MYKRVFVAGTFEGMHKGHEALLLRAFDEGNKVIVGITSNDFIRKFKSAKLDQFDKFSLRKDHVEVWLRYKRVSDRAKIIPIDDPLEPAASMPDLDAIVVSSQTAFRAREINEIRKKRNLSELAILEVPIVPAQDQKPISSTRLRQGVIDRTGRLIMPDSMRPELAQPLGIVLSGTRIAERIWDHRGDIVITVGDIATKTMLDIGVTPTLAIIDGKVGRKPFDEVINRLEPQKVSPHLAGGQAFQAKSINSGPGYISQEAVEAIKTWAKNPKTLLLIVDGEEDLLALPAIVHAPIGGIVYYGQPGEGLVEVIVTKEKKQEALALLGRFN